MKNLEIFQGQIEKCESCHAEVLNQAVEFEHEGNCDSTETEILKGFFYWFCVPGCMPEMESPIGPFKTKALARADALKNFGEN